MTFVRAARRYWLEVYPQTRNELGFWRERASVIPNPALREAALCTQRLKAGNSEGAAAFAVLGPKANRRLIVRMLVAFELLADYLDTVSETHAEDAFGNNRQLHRAIGVALGLADERDDYYELHPEDGDGGYVATHTAVCRRLVLALPSYGAVREPLRRLAAAYEESQCLTHTGASREEAMQAEQSRREIVRHPDLDWREVIAGGGSTLAMLALLVAAIDPALTEDEAELISAAYYPHVNSLHIMLDSVIDLAGDRSAGNANQIDNYRSLQEAGERLAFLASRSPDPATRIPGGEVHHLIVAGMAGYYLAQPEAWSDVCSPVSHAVLETMGSSVKWTRLVHQARRRPRAALPPTDRQPEPATAGV